MSPKATRLQTIHADSSISHGETVRVTERTRRPPTGRDRSALELQGPRRGEQADRQGPSTDPLYLVSRAILT
eukprot:4496637-Alexandrium_andersonii.AAC.1